MSDSTHPLQTKLEELETTMSVSYLGFAANQYNYNVVIRRNGRSFETKYHMGRGHARNPKDGRAPKDWRYGKSIDAVDFAKTWYLHKDSAPTPTMADVVYGLLSDYVDMPDFEQWCSEFDYDTDSRKTENTYQACLRSTVAIDRLFGSEIEALREAARDY